MNPETALAESDRLDSWKTIAEYLSRDVATVRRWEKAAGLPIRRVAGDRGRSVYAYRSEIDEWLKQTPENDGSATAAVALAPPNLALVASVTPSVLAGRPLWQWWVAMIAIVLALMSVAWRVRTSRADDPALTVRITPQAIVATRAGGTERWRYPFPQHERAALPPETTDVPAEIITGEHPGVLAALPYRVHDGDGAVLPGQLLWISLAGKLQRTFTFDDRLMFGSGGYSPVWVLMDSRIDRSIGGRRLAVAAHHYEWWPSVVTVLDEQFHRQGTFVNAGWIERVHWLSRDRLLIIGFSNVRDGGMVALLDANALGGQSPASEGSPFRCTSCGGGAPVRYVVLPRSEVNLVTASPFNRAVLDVTGDRLVARTIEVPPSTGRAIDVLYEFTPSLELIRASFSDRYWEAHRALEAQGKLGHTREQCPDRDGPRAIEAWEPKSGWTTIRITR